MSTVIDETHPFKRLMALPENLVGEIIDGELYTQPRPTGPHAVASSALGAALYGPFGKGRGGPGGWWIIDEPEVHFVRDIEIAVPDIGGWRRERMPAVPQDHRFEVVPDWVCEVLSPSTQRHDRVLKMKTYARHGVPFLWLVDPLAHILETYALADGQWTVTGLFQEQDEVSAAPFDAITIALADLWAGN